MKDYTKIISLGNKLYEYQKWLLNQGVDTLLTTHGLGVFMGTGTGKSITSIAIMETLKTLKCIDTFFIIAPKSLASTWRDQLEQHFPQSTNDWCWYSWDSVKSTTKTDARARDLSRKYQGLSIIFINVEAFSNANKRGTLQNKILNDFILMITQERKTFAIIDESSKIKSPTANRTKALIKISDRFTYKAVMTGSEISNSPLDIYSQLEFSNPGVFGFPTFYAFRSYYAVIKERYLSSGRTFQEVIGYRKLEELQETIKPYIIRAIKSECLDLPDRVYETITIELTSAQKKAYKELKNEMMTLIGDNLLTLQNKVSFFSKARQITGGALKFEDKIIELDDVTPKISALIDDVSDHSESAIIWCSFIDEIKRVGKALEEIGNVVYFYGDTSENEREKAVEDFRSGKARFFVGTPAACAYGLNLQTASLQYFYSLPTSPEQFEQAQARTYRNGQKNTCVYKYLIAKKTVDESIKSSLDNKLDIMVAFQNGNLSDILGEYE